MADPVVAALRRAADDLRAHSAALSTFDGTAAGGSGGNVEVDGPTFLGPAAAQLTVQADELDALADDIEGA